MAGAGDARGAPRKGAGASNGAGLALAVEVFARGVAFTRSFTHPYLAERAGPLWVMRDGPRRRGDYRGEEWIAVGVAPEEVDRIARAGTRGRFAVCAIAAADEPQDALRSGYRSLGYRLLRTEAMMTHALAEIPRVPAPERIAVERVATEDQAARLARATRLRPIRAEYLSQESPLRQYMATDGGAPVGWVQSIAAAGCTWCSSMYVRPEYRRRGIARAMLCRMLADDRTSAAARAVLLATHTGAMLYPVVGYKQIGTLLLYAPARPAPASHASAACGAAP